MRRFVAALITVAALAPAAAFAEVDVPRLWKKKCAMCHGADGKAKTKMGAKYKVPDISTAEWQAKWTDEQIREVIENGGKTKMPAFKGKLSAEEIDAMVKKVRELKQ